MQNLLTSAQIKDVDAYTIEHQPIASIDLMEQAAKAFVKVFVKEFPVHSTPIMVICGQGNNGGDGLAIARRLADHGYSRLSIFLGTFSEKSSEDYQQNLERLKTGKCQIPFIYDLEQLLISEGDVVIDALLGAGLNKPLGGKYAQVADIVNAAKAYVVAVDVPTGLNSEGIIGLEYNGIKSDLTISFQLPKLNFFFPESVNAIRRFKVVPIGLDEAYIQSLPSPWKLISEAFVKQVMKPRENFSHKGTYGHALIVAGNENTMGAALLACGACLQTGAGLTTAYLPQSGLVALNTRLPEVMALSRDKHLEGAAFEKFTAIAIGPGLGHDDEQVRLLEKLLSLNRPLVIDADGLNILGQKKELLERLPQKSILTPHVKEFDRLFGLHNHWWDRVQRARNEARERHVVILLKNRYTFVCLPNGEVHINPTGNPAMASGGMGDVLTGIIAALIAQSYTVEDAAILAAYLHGSAGDELAKKKYLVTASSLIKKIPARLSYFVSDR
jgi:ADP-dependent NAD(P)H-hydrate dehydratase / NAD(P)H-hydrate epimerase